MSKERQRRREERERQAAVAAAAAAGGRREAGDAGRPASSPSTRWLPATHSRQTGLLAEKRRREGLATVAVLVVLNILVFAVAATGR